MPGTKSQNSTGGRKDRKQNLDCLSTEIHFSFLKFRRSGRGDAHLARPFLLKVDARSGWGMVEEGRCLCVQVRATSLCSQDGFQHCSHDVRRLYQLLPESLLNTINCVFTFLREVNLSGSQGEETEERFLV